MKNSEDDEILQTIADEYLENFEEPVDKIEENETDNENITTELYTIVDKSEVEITKEGGIF